MITIKAKYNIGEIVYLRTDPEQVAWVVCRIVKSPSGISYDLSSGTRAYSAYEIELNDEEDILKRLN